MAGHKRNLLRHCLASRGRHLVREVNSLRVRPLDTLPTRLSPDLTMSTHYIFQIENLTKQYGQDVVLDNVNLAFYPGAKIGMLGQNGAGKSTLMRIMATEDKDFIGEARPHKGIRIGYFKQEPDLDPDKTVKESVMEAVEESQAVLDRFNEISMSMADPDLDPEKMEELLKEMEQLQNKIDAGNLWELERTVQVACERLRVPPEDSKIGPLSGGEKRRVALAQLLLRAPDMILLDEPTNHLDAESVAWLETFLKDFPGTVVAITHDRYFLDNVAGWILEIDRGRCIPFEGNYTAWLEARAKRFELEDKQETRRQRILKKEIEWSRTSPKARATKNKARLQRLDELQAQQGQGSNDVTQIEIPITKKLGDLVLRFAGVKKAYGEKLLFENLEFNLPPGGIIGVIGPNGAGKTTLFRLIMNAFGHGDVTPDEGTIRVGETVDLAYVDQSRDALDGTKTVFQEISGGLDQLEIGKSKMHARTYVGRFNFKGTDQQKLVGELSGGERNRVHLAKLLRSGGNLILLDEPTNDLDVETLRSLEEGLMNYAGCAMVSSHDRWFLDRIATHILAFEGNGIVKFHEGNYATYESAKKERDGAE